LPRAPFWLVEPGRTSINRPPSPWWNRSARAACVGGEQLAGLGETAALAGGEGRLLAPGQRRELLLEHAHLFARVVELSLQPIDESRWRS
jgi:hypothetical protein